MKTERTAMVDKGGCVGSTSKGRGDMQEKGERRRLISPQSPLSSSNSQWCHTAYLIGLAGVADNAGRVTAGRNSRQGGGACIWTPIAVVVAGLRRPLQQHQPLKQQRLWWVLDSNSRQ
jgi:hypothetical protein